MADEQKPIVPPKKSGTTGAPKTAPSAKMPKAPAGTSKSPATPKATAPKTTAPKASATNGASKPANAPSAPKSNLNAESAKQAELQSKVGTAPTVAPAKKRNAKKLVFLLVLVVVIAGIAVAGALIIPNLIRGEQAVIEIELTDPGATGGIENEELEFKEPVENYIWGDPIDRGIAVKNSGNSGILICFKLEIYENEGDLVPLDMDATPTFSTESTRLWTSKTIEETLDGKSVQTVYYYYNAVLDTANTLVLFEEYKVTADSVISGQYAEKTVSSRVTVQFIGASEENLEAAGSDCWQQCPTEWKSAISSLL